ncbi:hypothetical protein FRB90_006439 [Tulasnella sp. 427]|nr:hypothetical protein FRB90_006439 [Tulasnella sp. 427]
MAPRQKEPTKNQYSRGLGYQAKTPAFILALQQRVGGGSSSSDLADNGLGDGRPPIPTRPDGDPEEEGQSEESGDEKPQVVVLREGKHLSEIEVENEKRKAKGLPPLPNKTTQESGSAPSDTASKDKSKIKKDDKPIGGLSFSSSKSAKGNAKKRKVGEEDSEAGPSSSTVKPAKSKKAKKESKGLLSFGDGED